MSRCDPLPKNDLSYYRLKAHSVKSHFDSVEPELLLFDESCIEDEYFENSRHCVRVHKVRPAYLNGFISDDKLESLFVKWRDTREDIWLDGYDAIGNFVKPCFVKASKRGNDVYKHLVKKKFAMLDSLPPVYFFDDSHKIKRTPMVFMTPSVDTKRYSKKEAWRVISHNLNVFETSLRQLVTSWLKKQGLYLSERVILFCEDWISETNPEGIKFSKVSNGIEGTFVKFNSVEAHKSGYPHIHSTYLFHNWEFVVFQHLYKNKNGKLNIEFRLPDKFADQIKRLWPMGDVKIQGVQDTLGAFSEIKKYVTKDIFAPKGVKTCAMLWVHRKKSYSLSRCNPFEQPFPESIDNEPDMFARDKLTRAYIDANLDKWRQKDFIGSIWGKDIYKRYYEAVLNSKCGDLAEPIATDLVNATVHDYNMNNPEIVYFKFRGAILHSDLTKFLDKVPDDWSFLVDPPPDVLAEMRFYFGIDSPSYDSEKDFFKKSPPVDKYEVVNEAD